jgi:hypothetical protein
MESTMRHNDELETDTSQYFKIICEPTDAEPAGTHTTKQRGEKKGSKVITMTRSKAQMETNTKSRPKSTIGRGTRKSTKKGANSARRKPVPTQKRAPRANRAGGLRTAQILELLNRPGGATLKGIMNATGWQAHSVRGFLSGVIGKKLGLALSSERRDGTRVYSL